jgi:L-fucose mutarotase/ribose pyranase (RbsD/FucU family)
MRVDLAPLLSQIVAPTLLIESTWDEIVPASQQQALQAEIKDARIARIDAGYGAPAEVTTSETRPYGCVLLTEGVIR